MEAEFQFPFTPYDTQVELVNTLYDVLHSKKIGFIESPTGTGKTICIISAALRWLTGGDVRRQWDEVDDGV